MRLRDILRNKGTEVYSIWPQASLQDAVDLLVAQNCGSLLVLERGRLCGIITERDILKALATALGPLSTHQVRDFMTADLILAEVDEKVHEIMGLMTHHRIRHLPVLENKQLVGVVSIGDIVKVQHDHLCLENHYLKNYIQG